MSSSTYNPPSLGQDPALKGSLVGAFTFAIDKIIRGLDNRLPASIISFDRAKNVASVQVLIPMVTTGGQVIPRAQVAQVPVQMDGGGGLMINFPLKNGDLGWIEACDRDISLFMQTFQETKPNTLRKWSFADGKFTPSVMSGFTINPQDDDALTISTLDGTIRISISPTLGVSITSPSVAINGGLIVSGDISSPDGSAGTMTFNGNLVVTQTMTVGNGSGTALTVNGNGRAIGGTFAPT